MESSCVRASAASVDYVTQIHAPKIDVAACRALRSCLLEGGVGVDLYTIADKTLKSYDPHRHHRFPDVGSWPPIYCRVQQQSSPSFEQSDCAPLSVVALFLVVDEVRSTPSDVTSKLAEES